MATSVKPNRPDLHGKFTALAVSLIPKFTKTMGSEKVFDRDEFIDELSNKIGDCICKRTSDSGTYELDAFEIARYIWACLVLKGGDHPAPVQRFRGMAIVNS